MIFNKTKFKYAINLIFMFVVTVFWSQDRKFGDITKADFEVDSPIIEEATPAVVLFRFKEVFFIYENEWLVKTKVHERIKILSKEGLDYGNGSTRLYQDIADQEEIRKVKGQTYQLKQGKIEKHELDKDAIYDKDITENWKEVAWALPAVEVGSIVEWTYETSSPFWKIDDLVFQDDIPVLNFQALVRHPVFFEFSRLRKGNFDITPKDSYVDASMVIAGKMRRGNAPQEAYTGTMNYVEMKEEYEIKDIIALKEEPYVANLDNYRKSVVYELQATKFPNSELKSYSTSWEKVAETIYENDRFGKQLEKTRFLEEIVASLPLEGLSPKEKMQRAFAYVQNHYVWNGKYGKYVTQDLPKAFKEESGNVAEINLTLLALLKELQIPANPVLLSTIENGIPKYPTLEGYNYVIVAVQFGEELILLDATEKISVPGLLPDRVYNWEGRMVRSNKSSVVVHLFNKEIKPINYYLVADLSEDASITGKYGARYYDRAAMQYRNAVKGMSLEEMTLKIANDNGIDDITDVDVKNIKDLDKPISESCSFAYEKGVDQIGNKLYVDPLLFLKLAESPFKSETRDYTVNFIQPFQIMKNVNITLPEGYTVEYLPESINLKMPNDLGAFYYEISVSGQKLSALVRFEINQPNVTPSQYYNLKELYDQRVAKENEKVILVKN